MKIQQVDGIIHCIEDIVEAMLLLHPGKSSRPDPRVPPREESELHKRRMESMLRAILCNVEMKESVRREETT